MRQFKNITVVVPLDLYRQTRLLAAEYDTTVTNMVAYLIERLPVHLKNARFPPGGVKHHPARTPKELARSGRSTPDSWSTPTPLPPPRTATNSAGKASNTACEPVSLHATPADSAASRAILDQLTFAVHQYDAATIPESDT